MTRYFTEEHEWIDVDGDVGTVGITDYAQGQLGDITFVEVPSEGDTLAKGDAPCVVDSVKAASDVYSPVSGEVTEANAALEEQPELVNSDPEEDGWLFKLTLSDMSELDDLMDDAKYKAFVESL
ncbi:glycine cleavage system protein GcvH [Altererythrobacter sp. ZODW24]|uniref:glycine cleavage system protein GcvH n=1 Tax=Altererythrobacter sp. ZODW24 TaxID=2185142 RepID=UPI000DF740E3|nr:glycine cleavage system protein GcvH [Altererythrobacter sp. ZODW24]